MSAARQFRVDGTDAFIGKPFDVAEVEAILRKYLTMPESRGM
ncbi:MAG TPA: hypothetical protein VGP82_20355 [Ktedonobacterales bacterium]|nr:hypothetical protein [Ktedonobacterales bacterium]